MIDRNETIRRIEQSIADWPYLAQCPEYTLEMLKAARELLKAQEAVTPILDETGMFRCANCKKQPVGYKNYRNEIFRHNLYCSKCGRAVKWE